MACICSSTYVFLMCSVCVMYMCCIRIVQVYGLSHSWIHMYAVPVYTPDLCLFSCDCTYTNICIDVKLLIHIYICCGHVDLYEYLYKDTTICTYIEKKMSYFTAFQSFVNIHGFFLFFMNVQHMAHKKIPDTQVKSVSMGFLQSLTLYGIFMTFL